MKQKYNLEIEITKKEIEKIVEDCVHAKLNSLLRQPSIRRVIYTSRFLNELKDLVKEWKEWGNRRITEKREQI
jgi:hypothetical protein